MHAKYAFEAENKENLELLKLSNSLKHTCNEKLEELDECVKTNKLVSKSCLKALPYCDIFYIFLSLFNT